MLMKFTSIYVCLSSLFSANGQQIDFIRNGTDAPKGKYPFFVGLHVRAYGLICGGTLVHPSGVVLTVRMIPDQEQFLRVGRLILSQKAAHCRNFGYGPMPLFMLTVEMDGVHYAVQSAKTYPSFNEQDPEEGGDLMLLYFDNPDHRNSHVVRLNSDPTAPNPSDVVSLAGYGLESGNWKDRSSCLQEVLDLEVANCQDAPQWWFHTGNLLCTRNGPSHANVCTFDSGSPLLQGETQVGIVSLGDDDDNPSCSNVFAGFTPVALYYDWIHDNLPRIDQEKRETTAV